MRKKLGLLLSLCVVLLSFSGCHKTEELGKNVVNIYNWGEYIDPSVIHDFEKETGIRVIYSNYTTNEDLYVKLKNGGTNYDLIVPSEYMLERMIREKMVRPINFANIPNFKEIDAEYLHQSYDPEQAYSVPYFWGTLGIVYNKTMVKEPVDSWDDLWDPDYARQVIMLDSSRDSLGVALLRAGHSLNSREPKELEEAQEALIQQYPLVYAYLVDQTKDIMKNGEAAMAVMFSGDAQESIDVNDDLAYVVPKEGSNLWFDVFAIPANARNPEGAEAFINFMLRPDIAARNGEYVGYALPSHSSRQLLPEEYRDSEVSYPELSALPPLEVFKDPGDFVERYDEIWQEVKAQ